MNRLTLKAAECEHENNCPDYARNEVEQNHQTKRGDKNERVCSLFIHILIRRRLSVTSTCCIGKGYDA
jgi:hypothetical protein